MRQIETAPNLVFDVLVGGPDDGPPVLMLHGFCVSRNFCRAHQRGVLAVCAWSGEPLRHIIEATCEFAAVRVCASHLRSPSQVRDPRGSLMRPSNRIAPEASSTR